MRNWPEEAEEMLCVWWGLYTTAALTRKLRKKLGIPFTVGAVRAKASRMGLKVEDNQGYVTIQYLARECGVHSRAITQTLTRMRITTIGRGKCRYIKPEDADRVRAWYTPPGRGWITFEEAAKRLNYHRKWFPQIVKKYNLPKHVYKRVGYVPSDVIFRMVQDQMRAAS